MAKRRIVWTRKANQERKDILAYWIKRNHSKSYSIKLNKLIKDSVQLAAQYPNTGRKTTLENVRVKIVRDYLLFYEINKTTLVVLTIWDSRRDEKTLSVPFV
ncbi:addiction module RelE/StbE family toxin [Parabacteroides sp. PF5-5]|uniref:type II toxin-antitoxin system RelE/ParE family toxin n=1 Tax=unclassified Parabacteroides TaxID=2649774 RepID=UPI00247582B4|nr:MULTISPECIES: type II toxin-antitoxin system RelE/ParE family toxin [unclassified Parabacteroides]MDH6304746.1 addiction module RelE/StbE family toxin [Parabacteroides sp. PH5-39]MDH6315639.1 addiction module RelE/StbE family toxin [Parabacteroides sp. PF5-13]MDH6319300.1 addiction module RelE/StbE family toxin [Parabacteroides sp. PH5-13]MDH6323031.1 addiction module RelE/StbE family toxin [Parabacteroides sp. PH5-8]MDH6326832.1 addiction module RelE/StbE family toxin [Parabacteroides sp. 